MGIHQVQTPVSIINMIRMFINNAGTHCLFSIIIEKWPYNHRNYGSLFQPLVTSTPGYQKHILII